MTKVPPNASLAFLRNIVKKSGNQFAGVASDGLPYADVSGWIDTGSYILNALLSGSIFGGMPANKRLIFAGESAVGKTFFLLGILENLLNANPDAVVVFFESESAISTDMLAERGIDTSRVSIMPVATIEQFRTQAFKVLDEYMAIPEKERPQMVIALDSLGMLSTNKEVADIQSGDDKRDMTRAQLLRGAFRALTLKLGLANVPLVMTNHTYEEIGMFPKTIMGGGEGAKYAGDVVLFLSKKKLKEGTDVIGNVIHVKNHKSRLTIENKMVDVLVTYKGGLHKYYGLVDLALAGGVFKKMSTKIELPDGRTVFEKAINNNPEKYFTDEILQQLDKVAGAVFKYGTNDGLATAVTVVEGLDGPEDEEVTPDE